MTETTNKQKHLNDLPDKKALTIVKEDVLDQMFTGDDYHQLIVAAAHRLNKQGLNNAEYQGGYTASTLWRLGDDVILIRDGEELVI